MGWVGIGALAASVAFLLYYHPPSSWTIATQSPSEKSTTGGSVSAGSSSTRPQDATTLGHDAEKSIDLGERRSDADSPETTPKATPAVPSPQVNIPTFSLDGGSETSEKLSSTPSSSNTYPPQLSTAPQPPATLSPTPTVQATPPSLAPTPPRLKPLPQQAPTRGGPGLMAPPPRPSPNASLRPPPSAASSLRVPATKSPSNSSLSPAPLTARAQNTSRQVTLKPGHSPLDWAALTAAQGPNLRGANLPTTLIRVTPSMLKFQNGRKGRDAWTSYQNKVYNITPFLPFHPGGEGELKRGAGKDSGKLFLEYHPWVNWDGMLGECLVGILVGEDDGQQTGSSELDVMD